MPLLLPLELVLQDLLEEGPLLVWLDSGHEEVERLAEAAVAAQAGGDVDQGWSGLEMHHYDLAEELLHESSEVREHIRVAIAVKLSIRT